MNEKPNSEMLLSKPKRRQTQFLKRHIVASDNHDFVGRIRNLGIVELHFDSYEELAQYPDCKYAIDTGYWLSKLTGRVESLNLVGSMLWLKPLPQSFEAMPVSRYEWLIIATDVFLTRYVSVVDCALLLSNEVLQIGLPSRACTIGRMAKTDIPVDLIEHLRAMLDEQEQIRLERNARVHHGHERLFTDDDQTFRIASLFKDKLNGIRGSDMYGRKIDVGLSFRAGLVRLQREFNEHTCLLEKQLTRLYNLLWPEFESRFGPLVRSATHGLNVNSKDKKK